MSAKTNKLIIQEGKNDFGEESAEETKKMIQGDNEFDGEDEEFEATCAEEIAFDRSRAEDSAERARSHKSRIMNGYKTGTENDPEEEEEEENLEGNRKQPATNPIEGSRGWGK